MYIDMCNNVYMYIFVTFYISLEYKLIENHDY